MKYAGVVIDTKSDSVDFFFTYSYKADGLHLGSKVIVPFGSGEKTKVGYVFALYDEIPQGSEEFVIRDIMGTDEALSLSEDDINICCWMRRRYFCRYYDATACFLPAGRPSKNGKKRSPGWGNIPTDPNLPDLTEEQGKALDMIAPALDERRFRAFLIQGVTGSGKTELYMRAVQRSIEMGRGAIVLVPEISLTHQTIERFIRRFGADNVAVLHSKLTAGERFDEWARIKNGEANIVIGARSAVFAPMRDLGLIVVDEEHETTYKSDSIPKYDAIEVALRRLKLSGGAALLGSATPSVISRYRADTGIYRLITLTKRYNETPLPLVEVIDMRREPSLSSKNVFSPRLRDRIGKSLSNRRQVILFLNRRGYSPSISCPTCGQALKCTDCGISLTYHKQAGLAICHFCGAEYVAPEVCPACGEGKLRMLGAGTEKVEELTRAAFPEANIARLDLDTGVKKGSMAAILKDFEKGRTDILIGTQMIAKGLDFANVDLVGVITADVGLNIPDFRSAERTFQLITQVAGRSGRGDEHGDVIVQTWMPGHYAVAYAACHDYEAFYREEIALRKLMYYPPFSDIVRVVIMSTQEEKAAEGASETAAMLKEALSGDRRIYMLGPGKAPVEKLGDDYRFHIHIKAPVAGRSAYQDALSGLKKKINTDKHLGWRIMIDINPFSLL